MSLGMKLPGNVDEWVLIPLYAFAVSTLVGALTVTINIGDIGMTDVLVAGVMGHDVTVAGALAIGSVVAAGLAYGWAERDFDTDELGVIALSAGVPIGYIWVNEVNTWVSGNDLGQLVMIAVGTGALAFATIKLDDNDDIPILGDLLGDG